MLLVLAVLAAGVEAQLPLQLHPVRRHEELVGLDILSCEQTRDRGDILTLEVQLNVRNHVVPNSRLLTMGPRRGLI